MQASLDVPAAVHEFRIPPKALLGLHSYCPVHFDAFHSVLVDVSLHITLLKGGVHNSSKKPPRFVTYSVPLDVKIDLFLAELKFYCHIHILHCGKLIIPLHLPGAWIVLRGNVHIRL